jgi:uncharacterized protein
MSSSLTIDIGSTLHAGRPLSLDESVEIPPFDAMTFPQGAHAQLELRRVDRGIHIDGSIETTVSGECGRCLEAVTLPIAVDVEERFDPPSGSSDPFGENNVLSGTMLDVGDLVRQLVTSALPYSLVCSEDCAGLCSQCGRSKNAGGGCTCPPMEGDHGEP